MDQYAGQRPSGRPRSKSSFSLRSAKSNKSSESNALGKAKPKIKLSGEETQLDKRRKRLSNKTYADPSRAINEEQPATRNMLEGSTLAPLRSVQHKDVYGNVINDPDSSNPARARMERPLDTIRSFEAAIDAGYKRRNPIPRSDTAPELGQSDYSNSRRSSMVVDENMGGPRQGHRGGYGGYGSHSGYNGYNAYNGYSQNPHYRSSPLRHGSYQDRPAPGPNGYPQGGRSQRMSSAPFPNRGHSDFGMYNQHSYHESYDTVQTGDSTGSSEPWTNSTDPSSENSSVDRIQQHKSGDAYGVNHDGASYGPVSPIEGSIPEEFRSADNPYHGGAGYADNRQHFRTPTPGKMNGMNGAYPPPPPQNMAEQPNRNVIRLGEPQPPPQHYPRQQAPQQPQWQPRPNQGFPPPHQQQPMGMNGPPPPPKGYQQPMRQPSKLQRSFRAPAVSPPAEKEKRKSWFKRIF